MSEHKHNLEAKQREEEREEKLNAAVIAVSKTIRFN